MTTVGATLRKISKLNTAKRIKTAGNTLSRNMVRLLYAAGAQFAKGFKSG